MVGSCDSGVSPISFQFIFTIARNYFASNTPYGICNKHGDAPICYISYNIHAHTCESSCVGNVAFREGTSIRFKLFKFNLPNSSDKRLRSANRCQNYGQLNYRICIRFYRSRTQSYVVSF